MVNQNKLNYPSYGEGEENGYAENLLSALNNGLTLKDVSGISSEMMDALYKIAYDYYHLGNLNEAEHLFRFLCTYDFYNPEYAMGLAAVYHLKKNYSKAIDLYALSYLLSTDDYRPMFHAGQCNVMLRRSDYARKCFDLVIKNCHDPALCNKSESYLLVLNHDNTDDNCNDLTDEEI